ncbi:hypothetical protein V8E53_001698 [Lactarius tabidus]
MVFHILRQIRNVYLALHRGTDSAPTCFSSSTGDYDYILLLPTSYPVCRVPGHHPQSTSQIYDDYALTTLPSIPNDHDDIALVPSLPSADPPASSTHGPLHVDETPTNGPLVDNNITLPVQTTSENSCMPSSPSPVTSSAIRESIDTYPSTMNLFTPEPSVSIPPPKSISLPDAVVVKHTVCPTTLRDLNVLSSASPAIFLDDISPTGHLPSMLAPPARGPCREFASAADGEVSATAAVLLDKGNDVLQDDMTIVTRDALSQSPPLQPTVNVDTTGTSCGSFNAENRGEYPPRPREHYDIV